MNRDDLILRDKLALDRTILANQRTLLSYIKTSIFLISTAIGIFYLENKVTFGFIEWGLIILGLISFSIGLVIYYKIKNRINKLYE